MTMSTHRQVTMRMDMRCKGIVASSISQLQFPRTLRVSASEPISGLTLFGPDDVALTLGTIAINDALYTVNNQGVIALNEKELDIGLTTTAAVARITLANPSVVPRLRILDAFARSLWWSDGVVSNWPIVDVPDHDPNVEWQTNTAPVAVGSSVNGIYHPQFAFKTDTNLNGSASNSAWIANTNVNERAYIQLPTALSLLQIAIINLVDITVLGTALTPLGVNNLRVYVTDTDPTGVFGTNVTSTDLVFDGTIEPNSTANGGLNRTYVVPTQVRRGRFVIFDAVSSWGGNRIGIRRIELFGYI